MRQEPKHKLEEINRTTEAKVKKKKKRKAKEKNRENTKAVANT